MPAIDTKIIDNEIVAIDDKSPQKIETKPIKYDSGECIICLNLFDETTVETKCRHQFHLSCIQSWGEESNRCPECHVQLVNNLNIDDSFDFGKILCDVRKNITVTQLMNHSHRTSHMSQQKSRAPPGHVGNIAGSKRTTKKGQRILDEYYRSAASGMFNSTDN